MKRYLVLLYIAALSAQEHNSPLLERMRAVEDQVLECMADSKKAVALYTTFAHDNWKSLKIDRQYEIQRMGDNVILLASAFGHLRVVEALLKQGVPIDTQTYFGKTALFYAIENRHLAIIKLLLDYGADSTKCNQYNETPLSIAAGWPECTALLAMYSSRP
jgi:ankyrin repeat protein